MPRKYKGGAEKARDKKAAAAAESVARAALSGLPHPTEKYETMGAPEGDAIGNIAYANKAAAMLLHDVLTDKAITENERRLRAKELIQAIGQTGVKALYENRLKRLESRVYKKATDEGDDGLEDV